MKRTLGEMLSDTRKDRNLLQKSVADRLGAAVSTLSCWETDVNEPPYEALIKLSDIYNVNIDYLLGCTEQPISWKDLLKYLSFNNCSEVHFSLYLKRIIELDVQDQKEVMNYINYLIYKKSNIPE